MEHFLCKFTVDKYSKIIQKKRYKREKAKKGRKEKRQRG